MNEVIEEAQAMLMELLHLTDNHHYQSYSPQGLKERLAKISEVHGKLEAFKED